MKAVFSFLLLVLFYLNFLSAQKHDNNWVLSRINENVAPWGSCIFTFDTTGLRFNPINPPISIGLTGTSMSDNIGKLLFYTNGLDVINRNHEFMENGRGLNPGVFDDDDFGYVVVDGIFCLPEPSNEDGFYLFHLNLETADSLGSVPHEVLYTYIDMKANNGLGKVVEKNVRIMGKVPPPSDTLFDVFAATRHGNGRDWWVLVPDKLRDRIYRFQLTPNGIKYKDSQEVPIQPDIEPSPQFLKVNLTSGQNIFSPDGSIFVIHDLFGFMHIFDFDRCSGLLSNKRTLQIGGRPNHSVHSTAISPNNRFLYYGENIFVLQLDLNEPELKNGLDTIAIMDDYQSPFFNSATFMQLAPDGRIYVKPSNGNLNFHTIEAPNEKGKNCQFMLHQIQHYNYSGFHLPTFPNYRLYDLPNSPCDTLGIDSPR